MPFDLVEKESLLDYYEFSLVMMRFKFLSQVDGNDGLTA